jgi:hypothetical protein
MKRLPISLVPALCLLLATGCPTSSTDDDDASSSLCNGERDTGEFTVDDTYDADGDGYFDPSDPGCAATYDADQLDCDEEDAFINPGEAEVSCNSKDDDCDGSTADATDGDEDGYTDCDGDCHDGHPDINPGADEIPCNGVDEDCNGNDGEPCGTDYAGVWSLVPTVAYSCGGGAVQVEFSSMTIDVDHDEVVVTPDSCPACTGPTTLEGLFTSGNQFSAERVMTTPSDCDANFAMLVTFTGDDEFSGSLAINFGGADCATMGCTGQNLQFAGTRD